MQFLGVSLRQTAFPGTNPEEKIVKLSRFLVLGLLVLASSGCVVAKRTNKEGSSWAVSVGLPLVAPEVRMVSGYGYGPYYRVSYPYYGVSYPYYGNRFRTTTYRVDCGPRRGDRHHRR